MSVDFLDPVNFELSRLGTGFIDEGRLARLERRYKREFGDLDASGLGMATTAVGAWFLAQPQSLQDKIAPEVLDPLRARVERVEVGTDISALSVIFAKACSELRLTHTLDDRGGISVKGSGVGGYIMAGLFAYSINPSNVLICEWCYRPFSARAGAKTCRAACRSDLAKAAA